MTRIQLAVVILLLASAPGTSFSREPRIAAIRVGQHGGYDRIVVQFDAEAPVRWLADAGADIFEIGARARREQQSLASDRPRLGELTLQAAGSGSRLALGPRPRRTRAFLLSNPPRLVIDVTGPGAAAFEPPASVRALQRERVEARLAEPIGVEAEAPADEPEPAFAEAAALEAETLEAEADVAAAEPLPTSAPPGGMDLGSRALLVPLLAGLGVLLLAGGGLALAGVHRGRPKARLALAGGSPEDVGIGALDGLLPSADRLDLMEKRLDEEVRARMQLEEQIAQAREELGALRDFLGRARRSADG